MILRLSIFFSSFLPLWISVILIDSFNIYKKVNNPNLHISLFSENNKIELFTIFIILLLLFISIINLEIFIKRNKNNTNKRIEIFNVSKANDLSTSFLLAYILPVALFNFYEIEQLILFIIYFVFITYLNFTNDNIYINIYLEIRGYKFYNCTIKPISNNYNPKIGELQSNKNIIVLSKINLCKENSKVIFAQKFSPTYYINFGEPK